MKRVTSFTAHPAASGPEAILTRGSSVSHTTVSTTSITDGGTSADILFGLGVNFTNTAFSLHIGDSTPWLGLSKDCRTDSDTRLQKGTIVIHSSSTFTQMVIRSGGQPYSGSHQIFYLGSGTDCPVFSAAQERVSCRVIGTFHNGYDTGQVNLDSTVPAFRFGINQWQVGGDDAGGRLISLRANGFDGIPIHIDHNGYVHQYNGSSEVTGLSFRGAAILSLDENGTDTALNAAGLSCSDHSVLLIAAGNGNTGLGRSTSPWERLYISGCSSGHLTNLPVFAAQNGPNGNLSQPDLLDYDPAVGFKVATYDKTNDINNVSEGDFVQLLTAQTVTADRACFGIVLGREIVCQGGGTDTYTLRLGRLAGGGQAPIAPFLCSEGSANHYCRAKLDFGNAEGIVYFRHGQNWSHDLNLYGSVQGGNGMTLWGISDANKWIYFQGANNAVTGKITVLQGYVDIVTGNGFLPDNEVEIKRGALVKASISDSWGKLTGLGPAEIAPGQSLTIMQELSVPSPWLRRSIDGSGTLVIGSGACVSFDLDMASVQKDTPRLSMPGVALTIQPGARIRIRSMSNKDILPPTFDETFMLIRHNGALTGTFAAVEMPADFNASRQVIYAGTDILVRFTTVRGTIFMVR